jgi:hypothetical protein
MPSRVFTLSFPSLPAAAVQAAAEVAWKVLLGASSGLSRCALSCWPRRRLPPCSLLASSRPARILLARLLMSTDIAPLTQAAQIPAAALADRTQLHLAARTACRTNPSEAEKSRLRKTAGLTTIAAMALDRIGP